MNNTANTNPNIREAAIDLKIAETMTHEAKLYGRVQFSKMAVEHNNYNAAEKLIAAEEMHRIALDEMKEAQSHYEDWSRFFLVTNSNGHIHSSMHCSTCQHDTQFAWLPELAALTETDAVAEYGEILCSICFPSAPVEWTNGVNKKVAAHRELEAALRTIYKTPEGKAVKGKTELVSTKRYQLEDKERRIAHAAEELAFDPHSTNWRIADGEKAEADVEKARKQLAKAEAQLAAAVEALDAALAA